MKTLFRLYQKKKSLLVVAEEANRRGWTTKTLVQENGRRRVGTRFDKAKLHHILTNVTYTGRVTHGGEILIGEHAPIIDVDYFDRIQKIMRTNGNGSGARRRKQHDALLQGMLRCGICGAAMFHTYTKTKDVLYHYYIMYNEAETGQ